VQSLRVVIYRPIIWAKSVVPLCRRHSTRTDAIRSIVSAPKKPESVAGAECLSYFIRRVTFRLHETYLAPNRSASRPKFDEPGIHEVPLYKDVGKAPFEAMETGKVYTDFPHQRLTHLTMLPAVLDGENSIS
jgi:hypothetical protein